MMRHNEVYKGRRINITVSEVKQGQFTWSYTIDGSNLKRCEDRPLGTEEMLISEALNHAKYRIDCMPPEDDAS